MPRRKRIRIKPSPTYIRQRLESFRAECLSMEASGNHGYYGGAPGDDADMRRNICFWGSGRGWQLYKGWRQAWAEKYPDIELPPAPPPKAKPKRVSREKLEALVKEYKSWRPDVGQLHYFPDKPYGWQLEIYYQKPMRNPNTGEEWEERDFKLVSLGDNSEAAEYHLRRMIDKWKADRNLTGQEPRLGTAPAPEPENTSGMEPIISRKEQSE